jgi:hypothetical protein
MSKLDFDSEVCLPIRRLLAEAAQIRHWLLAWQNDDSGQHSGTNFTSLNLGEGRKAS